MIEWIVGLILLLSIVVLIYFLKYNDPPSVPHKVLENTQKLQDPKENDIVLSKMTFLSGEIDYSILWNGNPDKEYTYTIKDSSGNVIASSKITSSSSVFKIRKIPLIDNQTYIVTVNDTTISIPFYPPDFNLDTLKLTNGSIECDLSVVPTNMEIVFNKPPVASIPLSNCQIKMEPPGFTCENSRINKEESMYIMMYNGENASNILIIN
jgi:hypothetical protein